MGVVATLASDAERERSARALRDHAAVGRLTVAELESRLDRVYGARYRSELRSALAELPRDTGRRVANVVAGIDRVFLHVHATSFAVLGAMLVVLWALAGQGFLWPALILVPWGMLLALHGCWSWGVQTVLRPHVGRRR
jgi:hypothetical protein